MKTYKSLFNTNKIIKHPGLPIPKKGLKSRLYMTGSSVFLKKCALRFSRVSVHEDVYNAHETKVDFELCHVEPHRARL